jgi:RNA recognition motif-containing protein
VNYYTYDFYPKCRIDKISIYFIPIKHPQTNAPIHNLFVIKINILPGEPYNLYSLNNKGGYISTLRLHRQCINLTAQEIYSEIMKRSELLKQKYIQSQNKKEESKETDNNEEMKEENEDASHINDEGINEPQSDDTKVKKKVVYVVKITNIDTSLKIKDLNRYFNGCGASLQKFPAIEGKSQGYGEIHFPKRESAKLIIKKFNRMSLCGSKQINMRLTKMVVVNEN